MNSSFNNKKSYDTLSLGGNRAKKASQNKIAKNSSVKSVNEEDQWIGSLDNWNILILFIWNFNYLL